MESWSHKKKEPSIQSQWRRVDLGSLGHDPLTQIAGILIL